MKKRIYAALLALALTLALVPSSVLAVGTFADVTDETTARNVEVLRLLGVISGDNNGDFRPRSSLTRAEFCKMAVMLQGRGEEVVSYRSRTIFPDVRPSHWAAGYVNLASTPAGENQPGLMHGFPDGRFQPDKTISYGEAVTVLMRVLGYTDQDTGGLWPQGYIDLGKAKGLTKNLDLSGSAVISRADAAQLFVNALAAEKSGGGNYKTLGAETVLLSIDLSKGVMRTSDGKNPKMVNPMLSTYLNGLRGHVVYDEAGDALTFLPSSAQGGSGGAIIAGDMSDRAIIVAKDGSTEGFEALAGTRNYKIFRNGNEIAAHALKRYDVATWSPTNNAILVCDTRITVYYEAFMPTRTEPVTITVLGGTQFNVLPMAQQSIAQFRPGQSMVILLTTDGQIAGAVEPGVYGAFSNAIGYVDASGKVSMFCGGSMIELGATDTGKAGQVVYISQSKEGIFYTPNHNQVTGTVDVENWKMGSYTLADNVLVLVDGELTSLKAMDVTGIPGERIVYARLTEAKRVDLIVVGEEESSILYGRATVYTSGEGEYESYTISIDCGGRGQMGPYSYSNSQIMSGDYVMGEPRERSDGSMFLFGLVKLERVADVKPSAWVGTEHVTANGRTYKIDRSTPCYCRDTGTWFGSVEKAVEYGGMMNLYLDRDGVVRVIEVFS